MTLLDIILMAIALAMDCFTVSVISGVLVRDMRPYRMALLFGLFQALMPLAGWAAITLAVVSLISLAGHWIAFALLTFIGGKMVWESLRPEEEEQHFNPRRLSMQVLLAVATSIDALAVGISMGCTGYSQLSQLLLPLVIIGLTSCLLSIVGFLIGRSFGKQITRRMRPELLGGLILMGIGVKILITHL